MTSNRLRQLCRQNILGYKSSQSNSLLAHIAIGCRKPQTLLGHRLACDRLPVLGIGLHLAGDEDVPLKTRVPTDWANYRVEAFYDCGWTKWG